MTTCRKNLPHDFAAFSGLDKFFAPSGATAQDNKATIGLGSATPGSQDSDLIPAPVLLSSTKEMFKQFMQMYIKIVQNQAQPVK